ncbi:MAG: hypothetical protein LQ342_002288 [Letrouitia transgressa]|nr:MAG: hypothetical protein LQ342_002288 [Letrouitia transgressa]
MRLLLQLLLLFPFALAQNRYPFNATTLTSAPAFSSAAALILSQNFPASVLPGFAVAIESAASAASITGNINSLVTSVITATAPPDFITALPSEYQSRLRNAESQLNSIRSAASSRSTSTTRLTALGNGTANATAGTGVVGTASLTGGSTAAAGGTTTGGPAPATASPTGGVVGTGVPVVGVVAAGVLGFVGVLGAL